MPVLGAFRRCVAHAARNRQRLFARLQVQTVLHPVSFFQRAEGHSTTQKTPQHQQYNTDLFFVNDRIELAAADIRLRHVQDDFARILILLAVQDELPALHREELDHHPDGDRARSRCCLMSPRKNSESSHQLHMVSYFCTPYLQIFTLKLL